jgi:hypothetical protein
MRIDDIIVQLRLICPSFIGPSGPRIAGAANRSNAVELTTKMSLPYALVYPIADTAGENLSMSGLRQNKTRTFGVCVVFDNSEDRRGQNVASQVWIMEDEINKAILGWHPFPQIAARGIYLGDNNEIETMDRARIFWEYTFRYDITLTQWDGFMVQPTPITDFTFVPTGNIGNAMTTQTAFTN